MLKNKAVSIDNTCYPICLKWPFIYIYIYIHTHTHTHVYIYIQGVPGGKDLTSGECSLGQTIPI